MASKRIHLVLNDKLYNMLLDIMDFKGHNTKSETIQQTIRYVHDELFPTRARKLTIPLDPSERREMRKQDKDREELENATKICDALGGSINPDGTTCTYYTYDKKERYEQIIPLKMLTEDLVNYQYSPDKETVLKLHKKHNLFQE